jgi:hypothetical protein
MPAVGQAGLHVLERETLRDKIRGAWAGQMIGVAYGARTEFRFRGQIIDGVIQPEPLSNALNQDDLYVEMTFAKVMDTVGLDARATDYAAAFSRSAYDLWHANASARRNLARGLKPPWSGHPQYNLHANDIDFQIEADLIGIICPGLPREANRLADRIGHIMNYGDGVYGGMFVAGMYAAAFLDKTPREIVEAGLSCLPARSDYAAVIRHLLELYAQQPADWRWAWQQLTAKWDRDDPCPSGALDPYNIDAKLNGAYVALGLLYGNGELERTMDIATRCGQDSDCNPSSAAGVLGARLGWSKLPARYRQELESIADRKFAFTDYSFNDIVKSSEARALELIRRTGGRVTAERVFIRVQKPRPARFEKADFGVPDRRIGVSEAAWSFRGEWRDESGSRTTDAAGAEATVEFEGTGVAILGRLSTNGGRAEVFVDGARQAWLADAYVPERTHDIVLWHRTDLKPGRHTLRLVTRADADPRSSGRRVTVRAALVYRRP